MSQKRKAAPAPATNLGETASKINQQNNNTARPLSPIQGQTLLVNFELELTQHELWTEVLKAIELHHTKTNRPAGSQIVDLTIALRDLLATNQKTIEEVLHGRQ